MADEPVPPEVAYQVIHDELLLDGSSRLNLATFVTTWMEPRARVLMAECIDKNMIDKDEYRRPPSSNGAAWLFSPTCGMPRMRPVVPQQGRARPACWPASP
jgi:glutamate/tyrosine decarboxylase-like PLP-dependent enzyme